MDEKKLQAILRQLREEEEQALDREWDKLKPAQLPEGYHERLQAKLTETREQMEREEERRKRLPAYRNVRRLLVAAAVLVLMVGVVSARAFWDELADFFRTWYEDHVTIDLMDGKHSESESETPEIKVPLDWKQYWYIEELPTGVIVEKYRDSTVAKYIFYRTSSDAQLVFSFAKSDVLWDFDSEWEKISGISVTSYDTVAYRKKDLSSVALCWENGEYFFCLEGDLPIDEMVEMAENVVYVEVDE